MHKNLLPCAILLALLAAAPAAAQTEWIAELGFDEFPSPGPGYAFRFSPPTEPVLAQFSAEARLDSILRPTDPDLEKVKKVTHHLHFLIKSDPKLALFSKNGHSPLALFRAAKGSGPTDEASLAATLSACLTAVGIPARLVFLQKKDAVDCSKAVVEAWLADAQRWAVCDAGLDYVPGDMGHPLSSVELMKCFHEKKRPYNMIEVAGTPDKKFEKAVKPFLFGFCAPLDQRFLGESGGIAAPDAYLLLRPKNARAFLKKQQAGKASGKSFLTHSLADFYKKPD